MTAKEIAEKINELFAIATEQGINIILEGEVMSGDAITEAYCSDDKRIEIW